MDFRDMTLSQFTEELGSKAAVPGGGGAAALAGALGAALGAMVGNLTVGKKKYAAVEDEVAALTARAGALSKKLLALADADAAAFMPLSRAYALPKDAPGRDELMEACLRRAAETPMDILRRCCETIEVLEALARKGSVMAVSDAAAGAALCRGALYAAAVNVKVNTALMKRRDYAEEMDRRTDSLVEEYGKLADKIYADIYRRYC